jgi:hypothetical protein
LLTTAKAMRTAARPTSECIAATSSGICVISTRLATYQPITPPTVKARSAHWICPAIASVMTTGHRHAGNAEQVAATRGERVRQSFEREDEEDAGDEGEKGDDVRCGHAAFSGRFAVSSFFLGSFFLNISSIRSVTRKPPKVLIATSATRKGTEQRAWPVDGRPGREDRADDDYGADGVGDAHERRVQRGCDGPRRRGSRRRWPARRRSGW